MAFPAWVIWIGTNWSTIAQCGDVISGVNALAGAARGRGMIDITNRLDLIIQMQAQLFDELKKLQIQVSEDVEQGFRRYAENELRVQLQNFNDFNARFDQYTPAQRAHELSNLEDIFEAVRDKVYFFMNLETIQSRNRFAHFNLVQAAAGVLWPIGRYRPELAGNLPEVKRRVLAFLDACISLEIPDSFTSQSATAIAQEHEHWMQMIRFPKSGFLASSPGRNWYLHFTTPLPDLLESRYQLAIADYVEELDYAFPNARGLFNYSQWAGVTQDASHMAGARDIRDAVVRAFQGRYQFPHDQAYERYVALTSMAAGVRDIQAAVRKWPDEVVPIL